MHLAPVDLPGPLADGIKEPAVVRHHDECLARPAQVAGQPADRLDVQVVGRLVKQQQVMRPAQHRGQADTAALATR